MLGTLSRGCGEDVCLGNDTGLPLCWEDRSRNSDPMVSGIITSQKKNLVVQCRN